MHFIPKRYTQFVFYFFMALLMSGLMSLVITAINIGVVPHLLFAWFNAWFVGFAAALPAIVIVTPTVRKIVALLIAKCD